MTSWRFQVRRTSRIVLRHGVVVWYLIVMPALRMSVVMLIMQLWMVMVVVGWVWWRGRVGRCQNIEPWTLPLTDDTPARYAVVMGVGREMRCWTNVLDVNGIDHWLLQGKVEIYSSISEDPSVHLAKWNYCLFSIMVPDSVEQQRAVEEHSCRS